MANLLTRGEFKTLERLGRRREPFHQMSPATRQRLTKLGFIEVEPFGLANFLKITPAGRQHLAEIE